MAAHGPEVPDKEEETLSIELVGTVTHKLAISQPHGSKVANAFSGWMVIKDRLFHFTRDPHAAARPMQLEPHLIYGPKINHLVAGEVFQFFYIPPGPRDLLRQSWVEACACEIQDA